MKRKIRKVFVILAAIVLLVVLLVGGYTLYGHIKVDRILSAHEDPVTTTTQTHTGPKRSVQQIHGSAPCATTTITPCKRSKTSRPAATTALS